MRFEARKAVSDAIAGGGDVRIELDQQFRTRHPAAFEKSLTPYAIGGISNGPIAPLPTAGAIRPVDDLVETHGENLSLRLLIRVDGKIMAIATMVNTQHLMHRTDLSEERRLEAPTTCDAVLEVAAAIREAGVADCLPGAAMRSGWDLAQDVVGPFAGFGGMVCDDGRTPAVQSQVGVEAVETMKALAADTGADFLVSDPDLRTAAVPAGEIDMENQIASDVVSLVGSAAAGVAEAGVEERDVSASREASLLGVRRGAPSGASMRGRAGRPRPAGRRG